MNLTEKQLAWYEKHRAVMKAFVDGKKIQVRAFDANPPSKWQDAVNPQWSHFCEYRVKPESREFYIHAHDVRDGGYVHLYPISDERFANATLSSYFRKFREVVDEE